MSFIEKAVCQVDELKIHEKKVVRIENFAILLYRESENQFLALGNKCSHYGAPLNNGVIYKDQVICPWHAACFNIRTGDIEDFPGCDSIPTFQTFIKNGTVFIKTSESDLIAKRVKKLTLRNNMNLSTFVIIGGGPAAFQCAETLRQENFSGRIVLVTAESIPPYDRTKLSKSMSNKVENLLLRDEDYYKKQACIEILLKTKCINLETKSSKVYFDDGSNLSYDKIFIATGSRPRKHRDLEELKNVYYLRTFSDANVIHEKVKDKDVVLIGSSFIAVEIACSIKGLAKSVSIISRTNVPFEKSLGSQIGEKIKKRLLENGVSFYTSSETKFLSEDHYLKIIKLGSSELKPDICIIGIGSDPNTKFLKHTDITLKNSFIEVDGSFRTSVDNVFAGGDVVVYPNTIFENKMMNIAHWQTAQAHGRYAALAMLDQNFIYRSVPFFWSAVFGKSIRFCGIIENSENCIIDGDLENLSFVAYYFDSKNQVIGVSTMSRDPMASAFGAMLRNSTKLTKQDIETHGNAWFETGFH